MFDSSIQANFNPRPPWGGRPQRKLGRELRAIFQSTPSVGRATSNQARIESYRYISIHALRGEGDTLHGSKTTPCLNFNPRPPWGGRRIARRKVRSLALFQSTPSVGRATGRQRKNQIHQRFQSTPSVGRATEVSFTRSQQSNKFQSTPSVGRATGAQEKRTA